jgi:hypothetical protein
MRLISFFLVLISTSLFADEAILYSEGGQLIPVKETSIEMQKEILYFKRVQNGFEVSVYFEFYNPGEARDETVGFITPPWLTYEQTQYDVETDNKHPYIDNFMVQANGEILPYKVKCLENSGFSLQYLEAEAKDYIYYMQMHFKPGINIIHNHYIFHGYEYHGTYGFDYRLTTGKMWAKDAIGDIEIIIEAPDTYLEVPETFMKNKAPANWILEGIGQFAGNGLKLSGNVFLKNGLLKCHFTNFSPDYDLHFEIPPMFDQVEDITKTNPALSLDDDVLNFVYFNDEGSSDTLWMEGATRLGDDWIQVLINFIYARHGFKIANTGAAAVFTSMPWYIPDPALKASEISFSKLEKIMLNTLSKERTRRKNLNK